MEVYGTPESTVTVCYLAGTKTETLYTYRVPEWSHVYLMAGNISKYLLTSRLSSKQTNRRNWVLMPWARLESVDGGQHTPGGLYKGWACPRPEYVTGWTVGDVFVVGRCRHCAHGAESPGWSECELVVVMFPIRQ